MTDDQLELANVYLDGEATAAERAIVESDAELLAEVERMRAVRNAVSDVEPPTDALRESAIAAALAAFDELPMVVEERITPLPVDVTAPANIVPFERRRRIRRIQGLSAAAAAVVIVAGGVAITQRDSGRGTNSGADEAAITLFESPAPTERESPATDATLAATQPTPPTTAVEPMMANVPTTLGYVADQATGAALSTADTESAEDADPPESAPGAGAFPPVPAAPNSDGSLARLVVLRDEGDLAEFVATMIDAPLAADAAAAECDDETLKADAEYEDDDGNTHSIVVVVFGQNDDGADAEALAALTLDDCEFVLRVD